MNNDEEQLPIDLMPTERLAEALARRFDALVLVGVANLSDAESEIFFDTFGCFPTCYGATTLALEKMKNGDGDEDD